MPVREQDPDRIGAGLHARFNQNFIEGALITPERSDGALIAHLRPRCEPRGHLAGSGPGQMHQRSPGYADERAARVLRQQLDAAMHGIATTLYATAGTSSSVLFFYRGGWCSYCNITLADYQEQLLAQLAERSVGLVVISPQNPDGLLAVQRKHGLTSTLVSDPGNTIAGRLGILTQPSDECRAAQLQLGLDLTTVNADGSATLPMPAIMILDAGHTVRWIDVQASYGTHTEPQLVIDALDRLERRRR